SPARPLGLEVVAGVAVGERAPDRRRGPDPDRTGREVDGVGIFDPAWVALQTTEGAQLGQLLALERAEQVADRLRNRSRVRLDRDAIGRAEMPEIERGHDPDHRGGGGLVAAD